MNQPIENHESSVVAANAAQRDENWGRIYRAVPFLMVATQFLLIVLFVRQFHLESQTFSRLMQLAFAGFLIHHFLPFRWRRAFFALLSVTSSVAIVDSISDLSLFGPGTVMVVTGLGLIGVCHLPIRFAARVGVLLAIGLALAIVRANYEWFPELEGMWAVLSSMFIFRIIIYLYDLKHRAAPFSPANAVAYFFMLPNACFPLFPIVDYKTFCSTYYNDDAQRIYQSGIKWMTRGIVHLLLYRLVYHYGLLNISDVNDAQDVAEFMVATYLLYLRISGQFHLIVGLLHMFGFNLPETHHLYLLASSFTDFWRRINIYWKDFIMKIFFYPAFFALRQLGTVRAITIATAAAFFATWALHSWQWFWFRGRFLYSWQDIAFWSILAFLVLANAVYEAVYGRRRTLARPSFDLRAKFVTGLKTVGTFIVICSLWTLWSCQSGEELQVLAESASRVSWTGAVTILLGLAAIGLAGAIWGSTARDSTPGLGSSAAENKQNRSWWPEVAVTAVAACALALSTVEFARESLAGKALKALRVDQLNTGDLDWQRRGYYEELDLARASQVRWDVKQAPPDWDRESDRLFLQRDDFLIREMKSSAFAVLHGTPATTNRWGLRDKDYEKRKPPGTYRIVLLGSSHEVGTGVKDDESFENLVEDRLNRSGAAGRESQFEIINLSVGAYSVFQKLQQLEQNGFDFAPDAVIFSVCAPDRRFITEHLRRVLVDERPIPYPYLTDLFKRAEVDGRLPPLVMENRLRPFVSDMYDWAFTRLRDQCQQRGIQVFVLYRPSPNNTDPREASNRAELLEHAANARLNVLDLSSAYDEVDDRGSLVLAEWDDHTNAIGHRLLADKLFQELVPHLKRPHVEPPLPNN